MLLVVLLVVIYLLLSEVYYVSLFTFSFGLKGEFFINHSTVFWPQQSFPFIFHFGLEEIDMQETNSVILAFGGIYL